MNSPAHSSGFEIPRLCAHRGLSAVCPENTLPAFGAALALGVHEIEFDLWMSKDGVPVVCHDEDVARTTNGQGRVSEMMWDDLCRLDAGGSFEGSWSGVRMPRFEEVVQLVAGRAEMNIHVKDGGEEGALIRLVCDVLRAQGESVQAYLALGSERDLEAAQGYAPEIERACLSSQREPAVLVEKGIQYGCRRVQFCRDVTAEDVSKAHDADLICNLFWSDEPEDAKEYVQKGIEVILTNSAHTLMAGGFQSFSGNRSG